MPTSLPIFHNDHQMDILLNSCLFSFPLPCCYFHMHIHSVTCPPYKSILCLSSAHVPLPSCHCHMHVHSATSPPYKSMFSLYVLHMSHFHLVTPISMYISPHVYYSNLFSPHVFMLSISNMLQFLKASQTVLENCFNLSPKKMHKT